MASVLCLPQVLLMLTFLQKIWRSAEKTRNKSMLVQCSLRPDFCNCFSSELLYLTVSRQPSNIAPPWHYALNCILMLKQVPLATAAKSDSVWHREDTNLFRDICLSSSALHFPALAIARRNTPRGFMQVGVRDVRQGKARSRLALRERKQDAKFFRAARAFP